MRIATVSDILVAMELLGMCKTVTPYSTVYRFENNRGQGSVTITGKPDWWYYLEMDYESVQAFELDYDLSEPFISIGITDKVEADYQPQPGTEPFEVDASFFINIEGMRGSMRCPANIRQQRRSIIIRSDAWYQYLLPALMKEPSADIPELIRTVGKNCNPYIIKAITAFRLSDYEGEALLMQLNTLITGLFAELIHGVHLLAQPRDKTTIAGTDRDAVRQAQQILRENLQEAPTIDMLSRLVALNRKKLQALFQEMVGMTIGDYVRSMRMERAMELLGTDMLIQDIAHEVGYASPSRFSSAFEAMYKMSPKAYRGSLIRGGHPAKKN